MKKLNVIKVKYLPATNTKGTRIKLITNESSITLAKNYSFVSSLGQVMFCLEVNGFNVIGTSSDVNFDYIVTDTFKSFKDIKWTFSAQIFIWGTE